MRPSITYAILAMVMLCGSTPAQSVTADPIAITGGADAQQPFFSALPAIAADPAAVQAPAPAAVPAPKRVSRFKTVLKTTGYVALVVAFIAVRIIAAGH